LEKRFVASVHSDLVANPIRFLSQTELRSGIELTVGAAVAPGVTTDYLDQVGHDFLVSHGAYPSTLGYRGYPKSLCTSLNEVICHGIPDDTLINDGDIVNIDITAFIGGVHGDTNATFCAGDVDSESRLLVERAIYDDLLERIARVASAIRLGDPLDPA